MQAISMQLDTRVFLSWLPACQYPQMIAYDGKPLGFWQGMGAKLGARENQQAGQPQADFHFFAAVVAPALPLLMDDVMTENGVEGTEKESNRKEAAKPGQKRKGGEGPGGSRKKSKAAAAGAKVLMVQCLYLKRSLHVLFYDIPRIFWCSLRR